MVSTNNIPVKIYVDSLFDKLFISRGYRKQNSNKKKVANVLIKILKVFSKNIQKVF